jgi:transcriptional regulator with XRE-family HTH domain
MNKPNRDKSGPLLFSGESLRELREIKGLDVTVVAKRLTLSVAQLRQLEQNGTSLFYSDAIRLAAARKVADFLGGTLVELPAAEQPPQLAEVEALRPLESAGSSEAAKNVVAQPAAAGPTNVEAVQRASLRRALGPLLLVRHTWLTVTSRYLSWRFSRRLAFGVIALAVVFLFVQELAFLRLKPSPSNPVTASPPLGLSETAPSQLVATAAPAQPAEMVPPQLSTPEKVLVMDTDCQAWTGLVATFKPSKAAKDGALVYVVGVPGQTVCVRDSRSQVWRHVFESSAGRSFYGQPPFMVESAQLVAMQIYFQGARVRLDRADATRVRLMPAEVR